MLINTVTCNTVNIFSFVAAEIVNLEVTLGNYLISTVGKCCCTSARMLRRVLAGSSGGVSLSSDVMLASLHTTIHMPLRKPNRTTLVCYPPRGLGRVRGTRTVKIVNIPNYFTRVLAQFY